MSAAEFTQWPGWLREKAHALAWELLHGKAEKEGWHGLLSKASADAKREAFAECQRKASAEKRGEEATCCSVCGRKVIYRGRDKVDPDGRLHACAK